MSFTSAIFIPFLILYLVIGAYLPTRYWKWFAILSSSIFYGYWDWRFLSLIYFTIVTSWFAGTRIATAKGQVERKRWLMFSLVTALAVLGGFKYFNFFLDVFVDVTALFGIPLQPSTARIILPVGISFFTFQAMSYTIDLYRRTIEQPATLTDIAVYLSFFPQLVAGPIVRARIFLPQIARGPMFKPDKIKLGLLLIAWGYFLKVCLADSISLFVDPIFSTAQTRGTAELLVGVIGYSFQIYGDFAGYSLIAIGIAKLQGFNFPANFYAPYFARDFSDFWRRWHISLSSWLRDYLYISLGGNRRGRLAEYRNVAVTMLLGGLWHGASYNFLIWGGLHGLYLIAYRLVKVRIDSGKQRAWISTVLRVSSVYLLVCFAWVFFRNESFDDSLAYIANVLRWEEVSPVHIKNKYSVLRGFLMITITLGVDMVFFQRRRLARFLNTIWGTPVAIALLTCLIQVFGVFGNKPFIYFQF